MRFLKAVLVVDRVGVSEKLNKSKDKSLEQTCARTVEWGDR